jgi:serine phosphatase RsbU (regulator of sigma subunit)
VSALRHLPRALSRFSQGRLVSLLLLVLACLALYHIETTPLASLHAAQFDRYQRQMPRQRDIHPVVVVGIDNLSLAELGQWPWPRDRVAELIERIQSAAPLVVGIDVMFVEADRYSPEELGKRLPSIAPDVLRALSDPDRRLAQALAAGPSVIAVSGIDHAFPGTRPPGKPFYRPPHNDPNLAHLIRYPAGVASLPVLEQAASGEGFINPSPERKDSVGQQRGVLRQVPAVAMIDQDMFLSLPLEMVRVALGEDNQTEVEFGAHGVSRIHVGSYSLPTLPNGELMPHFAAMRDEHYVSAADVLAGRVDADIFNARLVLIGFNVSGLQDRVVSPLGDSLPGAEVHVQVIESLLAGAALQRPPELAQLEIAALALSGLLLIGVIPAMRPRYAIAVFASLAGFWIVGGYAAFHYGRWLFDASAIVLLLTPIFIALLSSTWIIVDARQRDAERALQATREETARFNGELDAARRIQMGLLPNPTSDFAGETRYQVAALLEPARAVGGDYYDCFALDTARLCFAIADVSGKGLPASLFMAVAKTLTGALARRTADLGQAMREVEAELSRENPECLFVTAFVGVLDANTGQLDFVRAGHDAPLLARAGEISRVDADAASGPPLCALGDYPYQSGRFQLQAGDTLCLFTDGVHEASNGRTLFGMPQLIEIFAAHAPKTPIDQQVMAIRDAVRRFEDGQPAADDLTLLLLRWNGPESAALDQPPAAVSAR